MSKHVGNITVTPDNVHDFPAVGEFFGHLTIAAGVELIAPKLTMIRGWLTLEGLAGTDAGLKAAKLTAPMLGLVDGWLTLKGYSQLSAIHLTEIRNDLTVYNDVEFIGEALATAGAINLQRNADAGYPSLTEVRDGVTLAPHASLGAPLLTKIGKSLTLRVKAWLGAPELAYIGGYLDCDESAQLVAPRFTAS